jgi:large subunit ribosomal protein L7/L12
MVDVDKVAEGLVALNVTELIALKKVLKDKYGIEEPIPVTATVIAEEAKVVEEKTEFNVVLQSIGSGADKLNAVKEINKFNNVGLKQAMELTKSFPSLLKERVSKADAESIKSSLAALNAEITIE